MQLQLLENQSELESNEKLEIQYIQRSLKTNHPKRRQYKCAEGTQPPKSSDRQQET